MKSLKLLGIVFIVLFVAYPISLIQAEEGHDHHGHKKDPHGHGDHEEHGDHDDHEEEGVIHLSPESQELGKIKTMPIKKTALSKRIMVVGKIAQDPEETMYVVPLTDIVIKECKAVLGASVSKGEVLCVGTAQDKSPFEVKAPIDGTIIAQLAKIGDKASPVRPIFALANMSKIGANFDIYERDAGQVQLGQTVLVHSQAYPDKVFKARIIFISPRMDETSNTLRIKVLVYNDGQLLRLGMNLRGEILAGADSSPQWTVPSQAIQTVEGKSVVFVKKSGDEFEAKEVKVLAQDQDHTAIEGDIDSKDEVVVEGSFILKSQMMASEMEHDHSH